MFNKKTVDDINVKGKRVLVRCDFNVPLKSGKITDDKRITAVLPTIKKLIEDGGRLILCSHLGKPKGQFVPELSLAPVAKRLSELLDRDVIFADDSNVVGEKAKEAVAKMKDGDVVLLENTRFRAEETKNDDEFSKELASLAEVFVNDAFGTAHRAHASNVGVAKYLNPVVSGYLLKQEIDFLGNAIESPKRPFAAILGGSKVSSKMSVIDNLIDKVDILIIGGGMAYTFVKANGGKIGKSLVEDEYLDYSKQMIEKAKEKGVKLIIPVDAVVAKEFSNDVDTRLVDAGDIADDEMGLDIGSKSIKLFCDALKDVKTVLWNGPMGVFEMSKFATGTKKIAQVLADSDAMSIIGGGDSAAAVKQFNLEDKMTHISTGGGASLEFLGGTELPALTVIQNK